MSPTRPPTGHTAQPSRGTDDLLAELRRHRSGPLHVIDPYKVPLAQAVAKAGVLADLGHRLLLVGSTDNADFDGHVTPYVAGLRAATDLRIVLHFPPMRGRGAPVCPGADGVLVHTVPNSADPYFVTGCLAETEAALAALGTAAPRPLRSASFAFGEDAKTRRAVASVPTTEDPQALRELLRIIREGDFDLAYLFSRHERVNSWVCRFFRDGLAPGQLLFVGGGVRTREQIRTYLGNGADYVVLGGVLETPLWPTALPALLAPMRAYPLAGGYAAGARRPAAASALPGGADAVDERRLTRPRRIELARELQAGLTRPVAVSLAQRRAYATNVGGAWQVPAVVARVASTAEVAHVLATARAAQVPVGIRGTGHSFGPQGLSDGGVLLVNELGDPELTVEADGTAQVSTRCTWQAVETALNRAGRAMPVLTNHLSVSVGGTLAVGGYGEGSIVHGGQVDLVRRARLVLPDGRIVWCSPTEEPELFRFALASLGQVGVLDRVVLRTVAYQPRTRIAVETRPDLEQLVESADWLAEHPDAVDFFSGQHYEGRFLATYGLRGDRPLPARLRAADRGRVEIDWSLRSTREARRNPARPDIRFVWGDYCVDRDRAVGFARFLQRQVIADADYARHGGRTLMLAVNRPPQRRRLPFTPDGALTGLVFGFGVYLAVARDDLPGLVRARALHRRILDECLARGGRPYLAGWYELDRERLSTVYGADYLALRRLRARLDPADLVNRGLFG
jgi:FAD/FMN-containing dehydrogenase/heptaprenylglyceryl phosphate synthase